MWEGTTQGTLGGGAPQGPSWTLATTDGAYDFITGPTDLNSLVS